MFCTNIKTDDKSGITMYLNFDEYFLKDVEWNYAALKIEYR